MTPATGNWQPVTSHFTTRQLPPKILHFFIRQLKTDHSPFITHHCTFPKSGQRMGWEWGPFFETTSPVFEMSPVVNSDRFN
jgi:hypothetical protein